MHVALKVTYYMDNDRAYRSDEPVVQLAAGVQQTGLSPKIETV
jgi:hypothetical protein